MGAGCGDRKQKKLRGHRQVSWKCSELSLQERKILQLTKQHVRLCCAEKERNNGSLGLWLGAGVIVERWCRQRTC